MGWLGILARNPGKREPRKALSAAWLTEARPLGLATPTERMLPSGATVKRSVQVLVIPALLISPGTSKWLSTIARNMPV